RDSRIDYVAEGRGQLFVFIAQSESQSEAGDNSPAVLHKNGVVVGVERESEGPKRLLEGRITRQVMCGDATIGLVNIGKEVNEIAVAKRRILGSKVLAQVVGVRVIHTELQRVLSGDPRDSVRELSPAFIGEGRALQECGDAHRESVGDGNLRRQAERVRVAGRIDEMGKLEGSWRLSELELEVAPVLETRFVRNGGCDEGIELGDSPSITHVVVSKARDSERVAGLRLDSCR